MEDKTWGELIYDNEHNCWNSKLEITPNNFVDITIEAEETKTLASKKFANLVFTKIRQIIQEEINIRLCAANKLIDLYNKSWNNDEDIDCQTFMKQLKLEEIFFDADENSFHFCYDDGNLFLGHTIIVDIDADGLFQDAGIAG